MKINKSFILRFLILSILLFAFVCVSAYSYSSTVLENISNNVFRLHVIANSDSDEDQNLKYKVRDALINYMDTLLSDTTSKEDAIKIANEHLSDFYKIANEVIYNAGYNYPVSISIDKCDFPTKTYGDVSLPAGTYDALRVKIGKAEGHNWWCVMFPPLCFVDVTSGVVPDDSKALLKEDLGDEEYNLITANTNNNSDMSIKFKIVEFIQNIKK